MWSFLDIWLPFLPHSCEAVHNAAILGREFAPKLRVSSIAHEPDRPDYLGPRLGRVAQVISQSVLRTRANPRAGMKAAARSMNTTLFGGHLRRAAFRRPLLSAFQLAQQALRVLSLAQLCVDIGLHRMGHPPAHGDVLHHRRLGLLARRARPDLPPA